MAVSGARRRPVQKFKPTSGRALGLLGIVVMVLLIGYVAASEHDLLALRVSLGLGILALLIWMTLLRPRADAYEDSLVLHNMVSDTRVPMASIDAVVVRHTLNVFIDEDRYTCV